jgi:negative regulator of sigma-B (phosphoserine phosphatase)
MDLSMAESVLYASRIRPYPGERVSGDSVVIRKLERGLFVAIVDVLGHGLEAHELTHVIDRFLLQYGSADVPGVITRLHQHLKGTRGAAMGLCVINFDTGRLDYAGIGNTVIRRFGKSETRLVSQPGVVGQNIRTPHLQSLELDPGDLVVLYTDGVSDRFTSKDYGGVFLHPPEDVANNIVQRFGKAHDDAACIALRYEA